jgi:glutamate formiminotransferase / formiminotetrahydrofolate cyclodeaminase
MPSQLVECIPNFSEARRPEIVEDIAKSIASVSGVTIIDRHSDLDHNRTVITMIGSPAAIEEAAFRGIARAAQLIDLDQHTGEHPRLGATDVVPFVPISEITMEECVEIAKRLGKRVGAELNIPVYLYEEAALKPERQNLENIRRGQYEALKVEMGVVAERNPDFGPAKVGPAGATVIGARQPLIAYNVYLNTNDVDIAQKIAKTMRQSSGGFRFVKAMGVLVEGRAQVSMNLTNYRKTPIGRVEEAIRREAQRYGVMIHHSELVGMIPQEALNDAAVWYLQLDAFQTDQILEQRLYELMSQEPKESSQEPSFLDRLASASPTPGGGSAAAFTAAEAAALVAMVARLTVGKKKYVDVQANMERIRDEAEELRRILTEAVSEDAAAFNEFMAANKMPKNTPEQETMRAEAIEMASFSAAQVPLKVAATTLKVIELAVEVAKQGNTNAVSDAGAAGILGRAALISAGYNVKINLTSVQNKEKAGVLLKEMASLEEKAGILEQQVRKTMEERGGF